MIWNGLTVSTHQSRSSLPFKPLPFLSENRISITILFHWKILKKKKGDPLKFPTFVCVSASFLSFVSCSICVFHFTYYIWHRFTSGVFSLNFHCLPLPDLAHHILLTLLVHSILPYLFYFHPVELGSSNTLILLGWESWRSPKDSK